MDNVKSVLKSGWHPEKKNPNGSTWRKDYKGINQVAGWMGKGYSENPNPPNERVTTPISSLPDPSSFAPPPKHVALQGDGSVAPRPTVTRAVSASTSAGPGYRTQSRPTTAGPPSLPPRLPPRQSGSATSSPASHTPPPPAPPQYTPYPTSTTTPTGVDPYLNPAAANNLARAGIKIPEFGIGASPSPQPTSAHSTGPPPPLPSRSSGASTPSPALPARFSNTSTPTSSSTPTVPPAHSIADLRSRAQNLRETHGEAFTAGLKKMGASASTVANSFRPAPTAAPAPPTAPAVPHQYQEQQQQQQAYPSYPVELPAQPAPAVGKKKPPPPPPPKKKFGAGGVLPGGDDVPPPIPLASKPRH